VIAVDAGILPGSRDYAGARLADVPVRSARLEVEGYDGGFVPDGGIDPFLALGAAALSTDRLQLVTAVAIAFARSPMITAMQSWNLQALSRGRVILGLGSQVKAHIERRYSMPWSAPAPRMREYVLALRAIWDGWSGRAPLDFRGRHYSHTLMVPNFDPGPLDVPDPTILVAALGPVMCEVAGEVGDGIAGHPFTTAAYIREVQAPAIERGRGRGGSDRRFIRAAMPMVITGRTADERAAASAAIRRLAAFYGSTPSYHRVLEHAGRPELGPALTRLSKEREWDRMADLIDDDLLAELAVIGDPDDIPRLVLDRIGDVDRVTLYAPYRSDDAMWADIAGRLRDLDHDRGAPDE
jgi:probable F420-dependent oxidoreductase